MSVRPIFLTAQDGDPALALAQDRFRAGDCAAARAYAQQVLDRDPDNQSANGIKQLCKDAKSFKGPKTQFVARPKSDIKNPPEAPPPPPAPPAPPPPAPPQEAAAAPAPASMPPATAAVAPAINQVSPERRLQAAEKASIAEQFFTRRQFAEALGDADASVASDPNNPQTRFLRANINNALRRHGDAVLDAQEGLKLSPNNKLLLNILAYSQNKDKRFKEALETADRTLQGNPTDANAHANRAYALGGLGDRDGMLAALKTAAALDPGYNAALQSAARAPAGAQPAFLFPGEDKEDDRAHSRKRPSPLLKNAPFALMAMAGLAFIVLALRSVTRPAVEAPNEPLPEAAAAAAELASAPAPGAALIAGKYELRAQVGEGGRGVVYEAFEPARNRSVAVKKMRPELAAQPAERERFIKEAQAMARVSHSGIVAVHGVVEENGELYLVSDYVEGRPLSALIGGKKRLSVEKARALMDGVCQAVDCAHRAQVLHLDLKPANIMIDKEGFIKVLGFAGERSGALAYMAPERHRGEASRACDVYSLGVCLYEAVVGQPPFKGPDFPAQKQRKAYLAAGKAILGLPPGIDLLIAAALEPDPAQRLAGAAEFAEALRNA